MGNMNRLPIAALMIMLVASCSEIPFHGGAHEQGPATFSLRQNDFALCGQEFYDDVYALTVDVFAGGAANVNLDDYTAQVNALVHSSKEFEGSADEFVEHIKDIPGQLLEIISEDPTVLDSCANFSVALVGPP